MPSAKLRVIEIKSQRQQNISNSVIINSLIALVSGVLMGLTVAPVNAWFLAWIAIAPLWVLLVTTAKPKELIFYSILWGIGYHGIAISWITGIHPMTWMGVPWLASIAIALFCWIFLTLWGASLVVSWAMCQYWLNSLSKSAITRISTGVALWCGLETLWSLGPLYWSSISYTQSPHNLTIVHLGQISGSMTVTAAIVAVNIVVAESWINRQKQKANFVSFVSAGFFDQKYISLAAILLIGFHLIGFALYNRPLTQPPETALKVGIIQGNVPNEIKLYPEGFQRAIAGYTTGYNTLADAGVDAVLTPEGALPFSWSDVTRSSFYAAVLNKGVVAWIGAFGAQGRSYTNSLFTLTSTGEVFSRYDKAKLVPIGEYVPFEQFLGGIVQRLSPLDEHQVAGSPDQVFDTPFGRAIASICYESAFARHFQRQAKLGGQFILSAANNAHYSPAMPAQHHAQDVMRAIETDRWAVRATNTGYSGIVDPHGKTEWLSQLNTYQLHAATIYRRETQTLYVRWGDWLTPLLLILSASNWFLKTN